MFYSITQRIPNLDKMKQIPKERCKHMVKVAVREVWTQQLPENAGDLKVHAGKIPPAMLSSLGCTHPVRDSVSSHIGCYEGDCKRMYPDRDVSTLISQNEDLGPNCLQRL